MQVPTREQIDAGVQLTADEVDRMVTFMPACQRALMECSAVDEGAPAPDMVFTSGFVLGLAVYQAKQNKQD